MSASTYDEACNQLIRFASQWFPEIHPIAIQGGHNSFISPYSDTILQRLWAKEHGITSESMLEILVEQVKHSKPDVFVFNGGTRDYKSIFPAIRSLVPRIVTWLSSKPPVGMDLSNVDLMVTDNELIINACKKKKTPVAYMLSSVPGHQGQRLKPFLDRQFDACFVGSFTHQFRKRINTLVAIHDAGINIQIHGQGLAEHFTPAIPVGLVLKRYLPDFYSILYNAGILPIYSPLRKIVKKPVFGTQMFELVGESRAVINCHADFDIDRAPNMRVFETMISGSLLICDRHTEVERIFKRNEHFVTYDNIEDLPRLMQEINLEPERFASIAQAGRNEILSKHSVEKRFTEIADLLELNS